MESNRQEKETFDVLISGMGPAAMSTAIQAALAGRSVCMLTNRELGKFSRQQTIFLDEDVRNYLRIITLDIGENILLEREILFLKYLERNKVIKISHIERQLYRLLEKIKIKKKQSIKMIGECSLGETYLSEGHAEVIGVDKKMQGKIYFTYLIGADGLHRHALNQVNEHLSHRERIKIINDFYFKKPHQHHVSVTIKSITPIIENNTPLIKNDEYVNFSIGTDGLYFAISAATHKASNQKNAILCNINCEIPNKIYKKYSKLKSALEDENLLNNREINNEKFKEISLVIQHYIEKKIKQELKRDDIAIDFPKKDEQPLFVAFTTDLTQASKPFICSYEQKKPSCFILVGDAYRTSYYHTGSGLNFAILQSRNLFDVFHNADNENLLLPLLKQYQNKCDPFIKVIKKSISYSTIFRKKFVQESNMSADTTLKKMYKEKPPAHLYAKEGNVKELQNMWWNEGPALLLITDTKGQNILHIAANAKKFNVFKWFYEMDSVLFERLFCDMDYLGQSPLYRMLKQSDFIDFLVNLNEIDKMGFWQKIIAEYTDKNKNAALHLLTDLSELSSEQAISLSKIFMTISKKTFYDEVLNKDNKSPIDILIEKFQEEKNLPNRQEYYKQMFTIIIEPLTKKYLNKLEHQELNAQDYADAIDLTTSSLIANIKF